MNLENLRALWDAHSRPVYAYLLRLTKSPEEASDHLQELFCRLARQPETVARLNGDALGFLLRTARNGVVDQVRRTQVRDRIFAKINAARTGESVPAADPDQALIRRALDAALEQLPAEQRMVMVERLWKKRTLDEIAVASGLSINTVASRYRYGLDKMREALRSLYEDLATSPSPEPSKTMKTNPRNPFIETEKPIIQPLEQRRVPSATGPVFALPVLPADDHSDEVPVDETPVDEVPLEDVTIDLLPVEKDGSDSPESDIDLSGDPIAFDDSEVVVPISFEDVTDHVNDGGDVTDPALDGVIYWAYQDFAPAVEGVDGAHDGEPVDVTVGDGHDDAGVDETGDGHTDDGTVDDGHAENGGIVPIDWVKRGDAPEDSHGDGTTDDPDFHPVIYTMTGAGHTDGVVLDLTGNNHVDTPVEAQSGVPVADSHDVPAVHAHDAGHPVADAAPATDAHATEVAASHDSAPVDLHLLENTPLFATDSAQHPDLALHTISFTDTGLHDDHGAASHESADLGAIGHSAPVGDFAHATSAITWQAAELTTHDHVESHDQWVPLHDHEVAGATTHDATADAAQVHTSESVAAHGDAVAVAGDTHFIAPDSGAAMAATGAMIVGAEPLKQRRKQVD
jgi:RNA polymerase sigma-70 factor (ECF subfamily)